MHCLELQRGQVILRKKKGKSMVILKKLGVNKINTKRIVTTEKWISVIIGGLRVKWK